MLASMPVAPLHPRMNALRKRPAVTRPNVTGFSSPKASIEVHQKLASKLAEALSVISSASEGLLNAFVDSTFTFSNQPLRPTEKNFAPVDEIGEIVPIVEIEGEIPADFPEGVYIRNGPNPLFGALQTANSMFGRSEGIWVEGEGMIHAVYFTKTSRSGTWSVSYANRYVQTDSFMLEKRRQKPCFVPATTGDPHAMLAGFALNMLRFGKAFRDYSNTGVFEHSGRVYTISENDLPHEIDLHNLDTLGSCDFAGDWKAPCTSHPKVAPGSAELVIFGFSYLMKPFLMLGVVSADGKNLKHKVDLKLERCTFCHEIGVTKSYNIIMDTPLTVNPSRMLRGAPLIDYDKESYAKIGVMPRYGDAESVLWFNVEPFCIFHLINCHEEGDEVIVRGIRVPPSVIVGVSHPHVQSANDHGGMDEEYFARLYEWRLNLKTKAVEGKYLTGAEVALEFPVINHQYSGLHHRYAYAQVVHSAASLAGGSGTVRPKFGGFAKLYLQEEVNASPKLAEKDLIKVEYHHLNRNQFCSGATFVPNVNGGHEDHGWIISFIHDEDTNISQAHIIDTRRFESGPVAKITLPQRVPYGFHATFVSKNI